MQSVPEDTASLQSVPATASLQSVPDQAASAGPPAFCGPPYQPAAQHSAFTGACLLPLQAFQLGTVLSNGIGRNLSVNALNAGPYSVLISNVNFGAAKLPYAPSGAGPKASSFSDLLERPGEWWLLWNQVGPTSFS